MDEFGYALPPQGGYVDPDPPGDFFPQSWPIGGLQPLGVDHAERITGGACSLAPCTPYWGVDGRIYYKQDLWSPSVSGEPVGEQSAWADDAAAWAAQRDAACANMRADAVSMNANAALAGKGCARPRGIGGLLVCAAGVILTMLEQYEFNQSAEECYASYPGPGKW